VGLDELEVSTIGLSDRTLLEEVGTREIGESPLLRNDDLLTSRELVLGTTESLHNDSLVRVLASNGKDDLTNVDTGYSSNRVTPGTTHTRRQPIGTSARQGLVGTDDVVRVGTNSEMERILSGGLDDVLVGANTGSLEGLGRDLLVLVRNQVAAEGEFVDTSLLPSEIEDTNLRVGYTTVVPTLGVGLVLAVAVATSGSASHCVLM